MHKRQAPQEIIETNEVDEAEGDDWNEAQDDDEKMQDSSQEDKSEESEAPDF